MGHGNRIHLVFESDANAGIPFFITMFGDLNLIVKACAAAVDGGNLCCI